MDLMQPVSGRQFAKMVGIGSDNAVRKAVERGSIVEGYTADKKYIPLIAAREWGKDILPEFLKAAGAQKAPVVPKPKPSKAKIRQKPDPDDDDSTVPETADQVVDKIMREKLPRVSAKDTGNVEDDDPESADNFDDEETEISDIVLKPEAERRSAILKAKMLQLAYKEKRGEMVPIVKVNAVLFSYGQEIRSAVEGIPNRAIDKILATDARHEAKRILEEEIYNTLVLLADIQTRKF